MSLKDKQKWDLKYQQNSKLLEPREANLFVKKYCALAPIKEALDLACGVGRNALFLESRGFSVDAIDISTKALDVLKSRAKGSIKVIEDDLDNFNPIKKYGLIIMCNYLDRSLLNRTKSALVKNGIYIVETYIEDKNNEKKDTNPDFLLKKDELLKIFKDGFEILEYKTFWNENYEIYKIKKASIAVKKI